MTITQEQLDKQQMVVVFHWSAERRERVISRSLEYPEITREDEIIWPDVMGREAIKKETHRVGAKVVGEQEILTAYNHFLLAERKDRPIRILIASEDDDFNFPAKVWKMLDKERIKHVGNLELVILRSAGAVMDAAIDWAASREIEYQLWPKHAEHIVCQSLTTSLAFEQFRLDRVVAFAMVPVGHKEFTVKLHDIDVINRAREEWIPYQIIYHYPWEDGAVEQAVAP